MIQTMTVCERCQQTRPVTKKSEEFHITATITQIVDGEPRKTEVLIDKKVDEACGELFKKRIVAYGKYQRPGRKPGRQEDE